MKKLIRETKEKGILQITTADERFYVKQTINKVTGLPEYSYVPSSTWICSYYPKGVAFYKYLAGKGWDESQALMQEAGEKGSRVHQAIEIMLEGQEIKMDSKFPNEEGKEEELGLEEYECLMAFKNWYDLRKPKIIAKETVIFNEEYSYAGTIDLICEIDGVKTIVDFKTGQYVWPSYEIQLSSYKKSVPGVESLMILQLGYKRNKAGWKETVIEDQFPLFLAARQIWAKENDGTKPLQKDYPLSLKVEVETEENKIKKLKKIT